MLCTYTQVATLWFAMRFGVLWVSSHIGLCSPLFGAYAVQPKHFHILTATMIATLFLFSFARASYASSQSHVACKWTSPRRKPFLYWDVLGDLWHHSLHLDFILDHQLHIVSNPIFILWLFQWTPNIQWNTHRPWFCSDPCDWGRTWMGILYLSYRLDDQNTNVHSQQVQYS